MKHPLRSCVCSIPALLIVLIISSTTLRGDDASSGPVPKPLIETTSPGAIKQIRANNGNPVYTVDSTGISVRLPAAQASFPGIQVIPAAGDSWDLSPFGHIEAKIVNTGEKPIRLTMRVDGIFASAPASNTETIGIKPGESKVLKVIFGYAWGYHPAAAIEKGQIKEVILFATKSSQEQSFRVEDLQGAGPTGEKPPFNPADVVSKPKDGVILGQGVSFDPAKQDSADSAQIALGPDGTLSVKFAGGKEETLKIKPAMGSWDLTDANQIRVRFKNVGATPITPSVVVGSNKVPAAAPIAPGAEAEIVVPFASIIPTVCAQDYKVAVKPGTGTKFESDKAKEFDILSDATPAAKSLLITSIIADTAIADIPDWLGKKPPVDGDWTQTFDDEFNGSTINLNTWNIYANNYWDQRTHFSKDNAIVKDGHLILHYEKKTGFQNDDEGDTKTVGKSNYACGFLNSYGKWTQRYGYFESRMKLPKAAGLWPAFWLMPDRGKASGSKYRSGTGKQVDDKGVGGMEFDIMEFLSVWGTNRYNIAMHWDGYGKLHKQIGSERNYVSPDKEGFITSGLLWTPGSAIYYCNGKEILRWENPRISDVESYIMYDMVSGGWANAPLDDSKLPDDFTIDYVRVWQRKDLATPEDGPKPNTADPHDTQN